MKWLNPSLLVANVLSSDHVIIKCNYYIARVSSRAHDPEAPARQATYLRAIRTIPEVAIHEGSFMTSEPWMPLTNPPRAKPDGYDWSLPPPSVVKVLKYEEKGSDVNLGAHLVRDSFVDAFDVAVVVTNDSDLDEPIRIATQEAGKRVGLLTPVKFPNQSLQSVASFYRHIRTGHLARAQLPDPLVSPDGAIYRKPSSWVDKSPPA